MTYYVTSETSNLTKLKLKFPQVIDRHFPLRYSGMYYNYIIPQWLLYTVTSYVFKFKVSYASMQNCRSFPGATLGKKGRPSPRPSAHASDVMTLQCLPMSVFHESVYLRSLKSIAIRYRV